MSTDDRTDLSDIERLRALILGEDESALKTVASLTARVGSIEDLINQDPVTVDRVQGVLGDVLHGLEGEERRLVQDRLMTLMLMNIQREIRAAKPEFVQAIYPVAGGLVRKGIQQALAELMEVIEERLAEPQTAFRRTQIRFQSLITGKPEAELWLRQAGLFNVDRILVVDRASGTVITGLRTEKDGSVTDTLHSDGNTQGEDQIVSGMLTAIMSFSQEAFGDGEGGELSTLEFQNSQLHIKATPLVLLVVRTIGTPPAKIDSIIDNRFDRLVTDNAEALASFDGGLDDGARLEVQAQLRRLTRELRKAEKETGSPANINSKSRPLLTFAMALAGVILVALFCIAMINTWRINSNLRSVRASVDEISTLDAYPITTEYDRESSSVLVSGLVPDAASAGQLETTLRKNHPKLALNFAISNIATDAVRPNLRGPRIEREANSSGVNQLRDEAFIRDTIILDLEQQVADLRADLAGREALDAALSHPSLTYDLDPMLGQLRDAVGAELLGLVARRTGTTDQLGDDLFGVLGTDLGSVSGLNRPDVQTIAGTLVGFNERGSFTNIDLALAAVQSVLTQMQSKPMETRLEILPVVRNTLDQDAPPMMEQFIASKVRALVVAQGFDPNRVSIRGGAQAARVAQFDTGNWRASHYVGFRLAY